MITADEFLAMGRAGIFSPEARLELVDGEIFEMAPIGSAHASVTGDLQQLLSEAGGKRVIVRSQVPLRLGDTSLPEPDVLVLAHRKDRYFLSHPRAADAVLVVEVSDTTLRYDLDSKVPLYAQAGIRETWVIDVDRRDIHVFRDPASGEYREKFTVSGNKPVTPLGLPDIAISADKIFPA